MFNDPTFWVAVSFGVFVILLFKPVKKIILSGLDSKVMKIKHELDQAVRIRQEAEGLLEKYKEKTRAAGDEASEIISYARKQAEEILQSAKGEIEFNVKKRTELAMQRIAEAESAALKEIKDNAVDITVSAAKSLIMESLTKEAAEELLYSAISEIERKYH